MEQARQGLMQMTMKIVQFELRNEDIELMLQDCEPEFKCTQWRSGRVNDMLGSLQLDIANLTDFITRMFMNSVIPTLAGILITYRIIYRMIHNDYIYDLYNFGRYKVINDVTSLWNILVSFWINIIIDLNNFSSYLIVVLIIYCNLIVFAILIIVWIKSNVCNKDYNYSWYNLNINNDIYDTIDRIIPNTATTQTMVKYNDKDAAKYLSGQLFQLFLRRSCVLLIYKLSSSNNTTDLNRIDNYVYYTIELCCSKKEC